MKKFVTFTSSVLPIGIENIDTDQIIPARFLKTTIRQGFGKYLFYNWRFDENDNPKKDTLFEDKKHKNSHILIVENNFGCGSSREHAVWALLDYGFSVVISTSFGDIFYNNSLKNGLLPIQVTNNQLQQLFKAEEYDDQFQLTVDLEYQILKSNQPILNIPFQIDQFHKTCLLGGVDELGYILSLEYNIRLYEKSHPRYFSIKNTKSL